LRFEMSAATATPMQRTTAPPAMRPIASGEISNTDALALLFRPSLSFTPVPLALAALDEAFSAACRGDSDADVESNVAGIGATDEDMEDGDEVEDAVGEGIAGNDKGVEKEDVDVKPLRKPGSIPRVSCTVGGAGVPT